MTAERPEVGDHVVYVSADGEYRRSGVVSDWTFYTLTTVRMLTIKTIEDGKPAVWFTSEKLVTVTKPAGFQTMHATTQEALF